MRLRSLSQNCGRARHIGALGASLSASLGASLCAGALIVGPMATPVLAAPTLGGDENGPQVQILQPRYQDVLKGKSKILIAIKAQKFNPQFVEMFIDDKPATTSPIPISALPSASYDWPTTFYTDGPHKLTVRVTDTQGFRGWAEVNVIINNGNKPDTLPPSLKWQSVTPFQQLSGMAKISLDAIDNFGVKWLIVSVAPASSPGQKVASWMINRPPYSINFDTTKVPDGLYSLQAKAWDSSDQEGEAKALTVGVVNGGGINTINATTIKEMLDSMRQMQVAEGNQKSAPATPKSPRNTLDTPDAPINDSYSGSPARATLPTPKAAAQGAPVASKPTPNSVPSSTSLQPTFPSLVERSVPSSHGNAAKSTSPAPTQIARNSAAESEVTAPQLANRTPKSEGARTGATSLQQEIESAHSEDWRPRLANSAPLAPRAVEDASSAQLSASNTLSGSVARSQAATVAPDAESRATLLASGRLSAPALGSRTWEEAAALSNPEEKAPLMSGRVEIAKNTLGAEDEDYATGRLAQPEGEARLLTGDMPALSQIEVNDATRLAANIPLVVEGEDAAPQGRVSGPLNLAARPTEVGAPTLSTSTASVPSRLASGTSVAIESEAATRQVRIATLPESAPRKVAPNAVASSAVASSAVAPREVETPVASPEVSTPQVSTPQLSTPQLSAPVATEPKVSTKWPLFARNEAKGAGKAPSKVASPDKTRVAALPRVEKPGAITAITVSPLEIKTSDALPAYHAVVRSTDLRAVAARYGLPVEVLAQNNGWTSDKKLVAGDKVKLPTQLKVTYQGAPVEGDVPSMLVGDVGVTAFRFMFEQQGGKMTWDAKNKRVVAQKGDSQIVLTIGSKTAQVGDQKVMMELAAFLFEGRTMIPVRFFEEGLHAQVEWNPQTGRLVVAMIN